MSEINVIFPTSGDPIVCQPGEFAPRGERVIWCIHSSNPLIKSVEIEFTDPSAEFFDRTPDPKKLRKEVIDGQVDFYGHVPNYLVPLPSPKIAKYTVRGYNAVSGGSVVAEVDPVIVTTGP